MDECRDAFADRAKNDAPHVTTPDASSLWDRMPSSPQEPPSSPSNDLRRLEPFGQRRTIAWACARERARVSAASRSQTPRGASPTPTLMSVDTQDTTEDEELRTPDASVVLDEPIDTKARELGRRESETAGILLMLAGQRL